MRSTVEMAPRYRRGHDRAVDRVPALHGWDRNDLPSFLTVRCKEGRVRHEPERFSTTRSKPGRKRAVQNVPGGTRAGSVHGPYGPLSFREKNGLRSGELLRRRNRHVPLPWPQEKLRLQCPPSKGRDLSVPDKPSLRSSCAASCAPLSPRSHVSPFLRSDWSVRKSRAEDNRTKGIQPPPAVPLLFSSANRTSQRTVHRTSCFLIGPNRGIPRAWCRGFVPPSHRYLFRLIDILHRYLRPPPHPPRRLLLFPPLSRSILLPFALRLDVTRRGRVVVHGCFMASIGQNS